MADYHSQSEFDARATSRRSNPQSPSPLSVFYHVALMPGWQDIVREQVAVLARVEVPQPVTACVLGPRQDMVEFIRMCQEVSLEVKVPFFSENVGWCEGPTLQAVWTHSLQSTQGAVLYLHTKGVTVPNDAVKAHWRRLMTKYVILNWRQNLRKLAIADFVGIAWQADPHFPHFSGNFWMARCDWLAHLQGPLEYRHSRPDFAWAGAHSWQGRMYAETWLGSKPYHYPENLLAGEIWDERVFRYEV